MPGYQGSRTSGGKRILNPSTVLRTGNEQGMSNDEVDFGGQNLRLRPPAADFAQDDLLIDY